MSSFTLLKSISPPVVKFERLSSNTSLYAKTLTGISRLMVSVTWSSPELYLPNVNSAVITTFWSSDFLFTFAV